MAYWLFQSNPKYYRILDAIRDFDKMTWMVSRFANQMSVGDGVLIWVAGRKAGVYAIAKLIDVPQIINHPLLDSDYWIDPDYQNKLQNQKFATIELTHKLLENPLLKHDLKEDQILKELMVIRQPQSTNYSLTLQQWERVQELTNLPVSDDFVEGNDEGDFCVEPQSISLDKSDRSLSEYHKWYMRGRLVINPEWQREYVWDLKKASRLIESFLIGLPVPVIYLAFNEDGAREVIDGLQRLTSVFNFFENKYELRGLEILRQFNGYKFNQLPQNYQEQLEDTTIRSFELPKETNKDLKFLIFERLNTGGVVLNDMEIRNCLYRGKLNDLIRELAKSPEFCQCINQKNLAKRMKDRALILRFLAFLESNYHNARKGMKKFLNDFLDVYRNASEEKITEFRDSFKKAMKASYTIFGDNGFRLRSKRGGWSNQVNASIFQVLAVSFTNYDLGALTRRADSICEEYIDLISTDEKWVNSVQTSTGDISRIEYTFTTWQGRLNQVMESSIPNDSQRIFSRKLKEELYQQNPTCNICQQRISTIIDAALDHEIHYWRGGKTIPENARLVHRQCNFERSNKN
ncbi:MAG: DUF262 domain-containing protein [Crocosphaera sp.]